MAKFGDHVLCCLASSLSNVIRQASRQNTSLGDFFRIQYLAFGNYSVILNAMFGFSNTKTIP